MDIRGDGVGEHLMRDLDAVISDCHDLTFPVDPVRVDRRRIVLVGALDLALDRPPGDVVLKVHRHVSLNPEHAGRRCELDERFPPHAGRHAAKADRRDVDGGSSERFDGAGHFHRCRCLHRCDPDVDPDSCVDGSHRARPLRGRSAIVLDATVELRVILDIESRAQLLGGLEVPDTQNARQALHLRFRLDLGRGRHDE